MINKNFFYIENTMFSFLTLKRYSFELKDQLRFYFITGCKQFYLQWGRGSTRQQITGQSCPDWLKMTSSRISKPNNGGLSRF